MKTPTYQEVSQAAFKVSRAVAGCRQAAQRGDRGEAYRLAEEAQHAAFELKELFSLKPDEVTPPNSPD